MITPADGVQMHQEDRTEARGSYRIRRNTLGGLRRHTVGQGSEQLTLGLGARAVDGNEVTEEDGPKVVPPVLREVALKGHSSLFPAASVSIRPVSCAREQIQPSVPTSNRRHRTHTRTISFEVLDPGVSLSRLSPIWFSWHLLDHPSSARSRRGCPAFRDPSPGGPLCTERGSQQCRAGDGRRRRAERERVPSMPNVRSNARNSNDQPVVEMSRSDQPLTLRKRVSSPFFMRFSISCRACLKFCPSMASWIGLFRRWNTASLANMAGKRV